MFLVTERLLLCKLQEVDFDDFYAFVMDREMSRMTGRPLFTDAESVRPTFNWLLRQEERGYAIVLQETGRVIGNLTVSAPPRLVAAHPSTQGQRSRTLSFSLSRLYRRAA